MVASYPFTLWINHLNYKGHLRLLLSPWLTMYLLLDLLLRMSSKMITTSITANKMTRKPPTPTPTPIPMLLLLSDPTPKGRVVSPCVMIILLLYNYFEKGYLVEF